MVVLHRLAAERGVVEKPGFKSRLSFSFGDYYNPNWIGFGALVALNENTLEVGCGFDAPRRSDLEILTYIVSGRHRHRSSLGEDRESGPGTLLRLSAGAGVSHREDNASPTDALRAIRIYVLPERRGGTPRFAAEDFSNASPADRLLLLASRDGRDRSVQLARDVDLFASSLGAGASLSHPLGEEREAWVQALDGALEVNGQRLSTGDGLGLRGVDSAQIRGLTGDGRAEFLLFDMACA